MSKAEAIQYTLLTEEPGLTLQLPQPAEASTLYKLVDDNRTYLAKWVEWADSFNVSDAKEMIQDGLKKFQTGDAYQLCIYLGKTMCGAADLRNCKSNNREPELGYWVAEQYAGKGYATKAAQALLILAQRQLQLRSVLLCTATDNPASNRIAEKLGFTLFATRTHDFLGTENCYKREWPA